MDSKNERDKNVPVTKRETFKIDLLEMILSLFIISAGVVLSAKAGLGISPISSLPYVISLSTGFTLGTMLFIVYSIMVVIEWIILRERSTILLTMSQLPFTLLFSVFVDLIGGALGSWEVTGLFNQWALVVISCAIVGFGTVLEIDANVSMLADDGLILAIHKKTRMSVSRVMIIFDVAFVLSAFVLSYLVYHDFVGVGLGTIFSGIFLGVFVRIFTKILKTYIRKDGHIDRHGASQGASAHTCRYHAQY